MEPFENQIKIPDELLQFVKQETYSLLIKGQTGTGKTTLALSILKHLGISKNFLYISTRISPEQIFQYHPWVEKFFGRTKTTELTEESNNENNNSLFVDARLDESGALFERITNELMDVRAPTIIIDTWDAIGFSMDREALMNNAKVLQTWRERARARIIFVVEDLEDKTFDFLVDGIVELRQKQFNERRIREIFLSKLRGIRINKPSYIFSVNNALFHSYDHYHPTDFANALYFPAWSKNITEKDLLENQSHFKSGYHELDNLLGGGFPLGSAVSIEFDSHVNAKIVLAFLSKIVLKFIATQNLFLCTPFEQSGLELIIKYQKSLGSAKEMVNILTNTTSAKSKTKVTSDKYLKQTQQAILTMRKKYKKKHLLSILGPEITNLFSKMDPTNITEYLSSVKSSSDLSIFISRKLSDYRHASISEIADIRLSLLEIDGTIFLQSDTPRSNLYAIVSHSQKDQGIKLEPIV